MTTDTTPKNPKKVLIAFKPALLERVDWISNATGSTRSDFVRNAVRKAVDEFRKSHPGTVAEWDLPETTVEPTGETWTVETTEVYKLAAAGV